MIVNIIDGRKKPYRWKFVKAIVEPAWHDNKIPDSDQDDSLSSEIEYEEKHHISLCDAVAWANGYKSAVTLFIYDAE